jgi:microcystin degradation protein MlrC
MKMFAAGLATETNSFCPLPTRREDFQDDLFEGFIDDAHGIMRVWAELAAAGGHEFIRSPNLWAMPAGPVVQRDYEALREELIVGLRAALPVDIVLLNLHGAMVAHGYDDCEGDILKAVREVVGEKVVLAAELDPHANLTATMVEIADLLIEYKEWPHDDQGDRAREVFDLAVATAEGRVRPTMAVAPANVIVMIPTKEGAGRIVADEARRLERLPGMLSVSVNIGFPWSDSEHLGTKVLAVSDNDPDLACRVATQLAEHIANHRHEFEVAPGALEPDRALDAALNTEGTTILCEYGDVITGGGAGDATHLLHRLIARDVRHACYAAIWDPQAVEICSTVGEGTTIDLRIGGKCSHLSGDPIDLEASIVTVRRNYEHRLSDGFAFDGGTIVHLRTNTDLDIILASKRFPVLYPGLFGDLGIDLATKRIIAIKAYRMAQIHFSPVSTRFLFVETPTAQSGMLNSLPYRRFKRNLWPFRSGR